MKQLIFISLIFLSFGFSFQKTYNAPIYLKIIPNKTIQFKGNVKKGFKMTNLSWGWNIANACFPAIKANKFKGNHILYSADLPKFSEMEIEVIPKNKNHNFSLYAYLVDKIGRKNTVPNLKKCVRCEADYKWDYNRKGKTQTHIRTVTGLIATNTPYRVVIGVVGPKGVGNADYTIQIKTISQKKL